MQVALCTTVPPARSSCRAHTGLEHTPAFPPWLFPGPRPRSPPAVHAERAAQTKHAFPSQTQQAFPPQAKHAFPQPGPRPQFLLSASMDKTVRLWHITMDDCLRVFK